MLFRSGFGLQFSMAGEDFESSAVDELGISAAQAQTESAEKQEMTEPKSEPAQEEYTVNEPVQKELTPEEKLAQAMNVPCPISKFSGKTLGEVLSLDPGAIKWVATKFTGGEEIKAAAKLICEFSLQQTIA